MELRLILAMGGATLALTATPAAAETISAECALADTGSTGLFIQIDTSAATAKAWPPGASPDDAAPQPASIGADTVTWETDNGRSGDDSYHEAWTLDRSTGSLNGITHRGRDILYRRLVCRPSRKLF